MNRADLPALTADDGRVDQAAGEPPIAIERRRIGERDRLVQAANDRFGAAGLDGRRLLSATRGAGQNRRGDTTAAVIIIYYCCFREN